MPDDAHRLSREDLRILRHVGRLEVEGYLPIGVELIGERVGSVADLQERVEWLVSREYLVMLLRPQGPSYETTPNGRGASQPWIAAVDQEWVESKAMVPAEVTSNLGVWTPRGVCHAVAGNAAFTACGEPVVGFEEFRRLPWLGGSIDERCPECARIYD